MSLTTIGLLATVLGPLIAHFTGFSEACSGEVSGWLVSLSAMLPGIITAQAGRVRAGGVTWYGGRK